MKRLLLITVIGVMSSFGLMANQAVDNQHPLPNLLLSTPAPRHRPTLYLSPSRRISRRATGMVQSALFSMLTWALPISSSLTTTRVNSGTTSAPVPAVWSSPPLQMRATTPSPSLRLIWHIVESSRYNVRGLLVIPSRLRHCATYNRRRPISIRYAEWLEELLQYRIDLNNSAGASAQDEKESLPSKKR